MSFQRSIDSRTAITLVSILFAILLAACSKVETIPCENPGADSGSGTCTDYVPDPVPDLDPTPDHTNNAPVTTPVTLNAVVEDSVRVITLAELLANASDVNGDALTVTGLGITSGEGTLVANGAGAWSYVPAPDDSSGVSFSYSVTDGAVTAAGSANMDITPLNDAPTTADVTLTSIVTDSGARVITQAELLANASDVDGDALSALGLVIRSGEGSLAAYGDCTCWSYTPAHNDDTAVSFSYIVTDNQIPVAGSAILDITAPPENGILTWIAPEAREDESAISMPEISGYRIYYGTVPYDYTNQLEVNDGTTVQLSLKDLPSGTYYLVVTAIDMEGRESDYSDMVTKTL